MAYKILFFSLAIMLICGCTPSLNPTSSDRKVAVSKIAADPLPQDKSIQSVDDTKYTNYSNYIIDKEQESKYVLLDKNMRDDIKADKSGVLSAIRESKIIAKRRDADSKAIAEEVVAAREAKHLQSSNDFNQCSDPFYDALNRSIEKDEGARAKGKK